jgi:hypothetical protein
MFRRNITQHLYFILSKSEQPSLMARKSILCSGVLLLTLLMSSFIKDVKATKAGVQVELVCVSTFPSLG